MSIALPPDSNLPEEQHWQLDWMCGGSTMSIYLGPALDRSVVPSLVPDRNHDMPVFTSLPSPTEFMPVKADMELKGPWDGVFVVQWLRGLIKDRTPEAAATHFSLNPEKYHRLPDILDSIAHFNYFLQLHGSEPIPKVTLEMHTLEGPFENRQVSNDIFHDNVAEVKEGKKYGFTICNGSPHALFVYLFYFDPDQCTIQAWHISEAPLPASHDGIQATRLPIGYGFGVRAFVFDLPEGKTADGGLIKVFVSTEYLDMSWIEQMSPFNSSARPSAGRLVAGREKIETRQVWDALDAVITMKA
ncbi:hypothetical protein B0H13DRAFT_1887582 [Mycena leptocephala]|nr:hypothetical protein B0H13DRAFT_1887582 [Mycena leptocephala]